MFEELDIVESITLISSSTMLPVPLVRNSKSLFDVVVVIKLSSINMSPVVKLFACIVPVLTTSPTVNDPPTVKLFVISTSASGIITSPVPAAWSSKFAFDDVLVVTLPVSVLAPVTVKLPLILKFPVCDKLPICVTVPVILVSPCKSVVPPTVVSPVISTLLLGTITSPVPFARNSKSLFDVVVVIKLSSINISPVLNLFAVIVPALLISPVVIVPVTIKSLLILKSASGINTSPVPFARSSRSALLVVVVIKLSSINISSNCAEPVISKSWVTVRLPSIFELPVCV